MTNDDYYCYYHRSIITYFFEFLKDYGAFFLEFFTVFIPRSHCVIMVKIFEFGVKMLNFLILSMFVLGAGCNENAVKAINVQESPNDNLLNDLYVSDPIPQGVEEYVNKPENSASSFTQQYMALVNEHRKNLGLYPLIFDDGLSKIVVKHSENMANGSVAFGHSGFTTRCSDSRKVLDGGNWCGENVAMGQSTPQAVFTSWMNSTGHRANIEKFRATHTGLGYARNSKGTYYWTQIFLEL